MVDGTSVPPDFLGVVASLALGEAPALGRYRVDLATGRWWWSDEIYAMHGFDRGEIVPTTAIMLAHKHPDDRDRVDHLWQDAARTGLPFSSVHRVVGGDGVTRTLAIVGQGRHIDGSADGSRFAELVGYFIDLTDSQRRAGSRQATDAVQAAARSRSRIDLAKGAVMVVLNLDEDDAFELLRGTSNRTNLAVRALSDRVLDVLRESPQAPDAVHRLRSLLGPTSATETSDG